MSSQRENDVPRGKETERSWGEVAREFLPSVLIIYGAATIGVAIIDGFEAAFLLIGIVVLGLGLWVRTRFKRSEAGPQRSPTNLVSERDDDG